MRHRKSNIITTLHKLKTSITNHEDSKIEAEFFTPNMEGADTVNHSECYDFDTIQFLSVKLIWLFLFLLLLLGKSLAAKSEEFGTFENNLDDLALDPNKYKPANTFDFERTKIITSKLKRKITFSEKARKHYQGKTMRSSENDEKKIRTGLLKLAKNKSTYCKLKTVLNNKNTNFKFEICDDDELNAHSNHSSRAEYDHFSNKILIPISGIQKDNMKSVVHHELHHAYINYQHRSNSRKFFRGNPPKEVPYSVPCDPVKEKPGYNECGKIMVILSLGEQKIAQLLEFPDSNLNPEQRTLVGDYLKVITGYEHFIEEVLIEKSLLEPYLKNGQMNNNLQFINPQHHLVLTINDYKLYAYEFEERDGKYIAKGRTHPKHKKVQAPLHDYTYLTKRYIPPSLNWSDKIKEKDAIIHQLFEAYPMLYDYFFAGLDDYHTQRSDEEYQDCLKQP